MAKKTEFKATALRSLLASVLVIIILAASVGFYFAQDYLYNTFVKQDISSPGKLDTGTDDIVTVQNKITARQTLATAADGIFEPKDTYQTAAATDFNRYAADNGITISSTDWKESASNASNGLATPGMPTSGSSTLTPYKSYQATLTLKNPIVYDDYFKFLKAIETNAPKMQITEISVSPSSSKKNYITSDKLVVEVYTR